MKTGLELATDRLGPSLVAWILEAEQDSDRLVDYINMVFDEISINQEEGDDTARAWFTGKNLYLGFMAPAEGLKLGKFQEVLDAAYRGFEMGI